MLTSQQRKRVVWLLVLMVIGMSLETLGVGMVVPTLVLLLQDDLGSKYPFVEPLMNFLGKPSHSTMVIYGMSSLAAVFFLKNVYLAFLTWQQTRIAFSIQADMAQSLFNIYLKQPYTFHLQRNSAPLIRNASAEVGTFCNYAIRPLMNLTSELLVLAGIFGLLLWVEPLGTLVVAILMIAVGFVYYRLTKPLLKKWGEERLHHDGKRFQHLQQGLGGAKDVKLLGRERDFLHQYSFHNQRSTKISEYHQTLAQLPRLGLECLGVAGMACVAIVMVLGGREPAALVPTMGLVGAAAFRLMPSANRIITAIQAIRFGIPVINTLYLEFQLPLPSEAAKTISGTSILQDSISIKNIVFKYPGAHDAALNDVSLSIRKGESIGVIGTSGSGKSTLIDIILGLFDPDLGDIIVDGKNIQDEMRGWQNQIGYVPQSIYLTDDSLRRNVAFGLAEDEIDDAAVRRAICSAQLEDFVDSLPLGLETMVGERGVRLSGGQRQRIGVARALYHDPGVLVLDEATSALDNSTELGVMESVAALHGQKTIVIVAHRLSTVAHCDRLICLEQGRVVKSGTYSEVTGNLN